MIPIVGNTDAHHCRELAINNTIVFAENNELGALQKAVCAGNSIALSQYPDAPPRTAGKFLLVHFYHFLRKCYYPRHDALCVQESELMFRALENGTPDTEYDEFITLPYKKRRDSDRQLKKVTFNVDTAAFAALKAARMQLDKEFWG